MGMLGQLILGIMLVQLVLMEIRLELRKLGMKLLQMIQMLL